MKKLISMIAIAVLATGCATSEKVQTAQTGDKSLSCADITKEFKKLDAAEADVKSKKGVTGTNVAGALLWLPGLAYTFYDAGQATDAISARRSRLVELSDHKNCK